MPFQGFQSFVEKAPLAFRQRLGVAFQALPEDLHQLAPFPGRELECRMSKVLASHGSTV